MHDDFLEGEREKGWARLYREKESRGNTWKDRVIYCYSRLQHGVVVVFAIVFVVCGCQERKGAGGGGGFRVSALVGLFLPPPFASPGRFFSSCLSCPALAVRPLRSVSTNTDTRPSWCYNTATRVGTTALGRSSSSRAPSLPYVVLCQGPSLQRAYATGRPLSVYPAGCPTPTYMAAAQLYLRPVDPVHTLRPPPPASPPPTPSSPVPLPLPPSLSRGPRIKFILLNDFIILLRKFNTKLLLRQDSPSSDEAEEGKRPQTRGETACNFDLRASKNCLSGEQRPREVPPTVDPSECFKSDPTTRCIYSHF